MSGFAPYIVEQLRRVQAKLNERTVKCADPTLVVNDVPWFTVPKEEEK